MRQRFAEGFFFAPGRGKGGSGVRRPPEGGAEGPGCGGGTAGEWAVKVREGRGGLRRDSLGDSARVRVFNLYFTIGILRYGECDELHQDNALPV